jgi:hypothetical protein
LSSWRRLSSSIGSPISSRSRASTGIGITESSRRITRCGGPSPLWRSGTSASGGMPRRRPLSLWERAGVRGHAATSDVTYHGRIARHGVECHRDGGVGPFPLDSFDDLVAHAAMVRAVIDRGTMPPWFAAAARSAAWRRSFIPGSRSRPRQRSTARRPRCGCPTTHDHGLPPAPSRARQGLPLRGGPR